ncbi:Gfo/Idh/MocA family oxidoreductase [Spirosoma sp. BT702]|uniref:Gfo/Idh/MocA family oxidoreductase n=1 Tax=Spirosoma profusum TaxID=2771354 RepID=A0A926XXQ2_9BACT|nr:Gfo/Idh/MocA family oxidoreductase [Spirosoma profusum]MBD2699902.1 Gfo/Idh/MocA family oxidoreductase [Spirosoma profusum]
MPSSRRDFLQKSTQLAAGLSLATLPTTAQQRLAADAIRIGLIGVNNMGWADLTSMLKNPDAVCVALCDVDSNVLNKRAAELEKKTGKKVTLYNDFRKLIDDKSVDAVIVGTPDHWHCLPAVYACQAGKDVYVEKPLANSIEECDLIVAAAKRYNRIIQVGQWQRSGEHWKAALAYVQSGKIGPVRTVKTWAFMGYGKEFPPKPDVAAPAGVDYDMWLGPAPNRPFNPNRFHGSFRYYWDYAGGLMTDWGAHMIDVALWGMNVAAPRSVVATGGKFGFPDHDGDTPDTMQVVYDYGKFSVLWEQSLGTVRGPYDRDHGVAFIGNLGTVVIDRGKWEVLPEVEQGRYLSPAMPIQKATANDLDAHTRNFLDCIRSRKQPNCPAEVGRNVALHSHLGNIAYRTGHKLVWEAEKGMIVDDTSAQQLAKAHYRSPWTLPKVS